MARLEEIKRGATVKGILPDGVVIVVDVSWIGSVAIELTYKDSNGRLANELIYRDRESEIEIIEAGKPWSFDGDPGLFRLVSEAHRIRLAYLFDPLLAVHTSLIEPLPHQITAVYETMLPRQPLRFLLADDPGAGKTIMTGLLIKELIARGDLQRCLIVCPGNLVEQWQDELYRRFQLPFEIMTNDKYEAARTGNWFTENPLSICRLDKLSRNEDVQEKLKTTDWDLVVCDEAHKMSASFWSGEIRRTKRHQLGQLLSTLTRHFLLLTATPHNGKEEDFQLFMSLLDGDRFEGKFRDGVHSINVSDLMRRMVKEDLLKFDGRPLFPERRAYTVEYELSDGEAELYQRVTEYVREEFNRAEQLNNDGRKRTVGFALTVLQRRLASSPEAIYQSLRRRKERLEKRCREEELLKRGAEVRIDWQRDIPELSEDDLEDLDDAPDHEVEDTEERVVDLATAAQTIAELKAEIAILKKLEQAALRVRQSQTDRKWDELSRLLQNQSEMFDAHGHRRKLIIFTEHRDTLNYLQYRIGSLIGKPEAVVAIHGGMGREERRKSETLFTQDKDVEVLVATDAAGEGINLQRAHLMVNYDLPWNPNRLEQRFGRIHRIGQTEVCHCWNLVASKTREGDVYRRLLEKLEEERKALGGKVFDILGELLFAEQPLRMLLMEAIRYGDRPEVRARLNEVVDQAMDRDKLRDLIEAHALSHDSMNVSRVQAIREDMERAEARRLQPHFVAAFFNEAFKRLGGTLREREPKRYEAPHVPAVIRNRDRIIGTRDPVLTRYERLAFEKNLISVPGKPLAEFICPGHPLLDATIDLILERYRDLLRQGAILIDENSLDDEMRALVYLEHSIQDARTDRSGNRRVVSRQVQFTEVTASGAVRCAGYAPYLDYRPPTKAELDLIRQMKEPEWLCSSIESRALDYAVRNLVPTHLQEVKSRKEQLVDKTMAAVKERLTAEISYWDHQAEQLKQQEQAGKANAKINSGKARQRADDLTMRLRRRMEELQQERRITPLPPNVLGAALVIPAGLLVRMEDGSTAPAHAKETRAVEQVAMEAVMAAERRLGFEPRDVAATKCGYDIESRDSTGSARLRFIEVKGRVQGADTVTITKNEILTALNKPEQFILAIVQVDSERTEAITYVRDPFGREPDFGVTSVNYRLAELLNKGGPPG
ncbi:MAG: helicase-related protein [Kiritimatiellia bacterium]|jgi:superfamily II DNA or RNA helicase